MLQSVIYSIPQKKSNSSRGRWILQPLTGHSTGLTHPAVCSLCSIVHIGTQLVCIVCHSVLQLHDRKVYIVAHSSGTNRLQLCSTCGCSIPCIIILQEFQHLCKSTQLARPYTTLQYHQQFSFHFYSEFQHLCKSTQLGHKPHCTINVSYRDNQFTQLQ